MVGLAVVSAVMVAGGFFIGRQVEGSDQAGRDPRGYQLDGGDLPLDDGLQRAGVGVPECARENLRYAFVGNGFGHYRDVYLRVSGSEDCVNSFLEANGLHDDLKATRSGGAAAERPLEVRDRWLDREPVAKMGWQVGPEQRFQRFVGQRANSYTATVMVQHTPDPPVVRAYLYAFYGG
ncbi:hypothetical protein [Micromonospora sp. NPDC004704]